MTRYIRAFVALVVLFVQATLHSQTLSNTSEWLTTRDRASLLNLQAEPLAFTRSNAGPGQPTITMDDKQTFQAIDGFGFALTGGSAELLMKMTSAARHHLLMELFSTKDAGIGVSYLRLSIGSSDMNEHVFTYDDLPAGQKDPQLKQFHLGSDLLDVVPVLREILEIAPDLKILASPWSAPPWMKSNHLSKGGSLQPEFYDAYARYLVAYIHAMDRHGIRIDAITPQNEPLNPKNTPSMVMTAEEEAAFISRSLGPAFRKEHVRTKIILYDHNCDRPDYPLTILANPDAAPFVDGSGFHLYGGTIDALTKVHEAYPAKNLYFTEQMVIDNPRRPSELEIAESVSRVVIGATTNWSRSVLLWNLAADRNFGPHTPDGGCPICEGAITLEGDTVTRNLAYYTIAQASKFVRPGAYRIASEVSGDAPAHVAFRNPDGSFALLVANTTDAIKSFKVRFHGQTINTSVPSGSVATYTWRMN